jgi:LysR family transcriptional regulator, hydrogen peroxide-inducible genes activator
MNLSQLQYAKAVADTKSFSRAAEICFVTQPTLSNAIFQLEEELGGKLFSRTTRKVSLTDFGEFMLPYLENLLTAQANLLKQAKSYQKTEEMMFRLGLSPLINTALLSNIIEPFQTKHPELTFVFTEMNLLDLQNQLYDGKLDFIFVPISAPSTSLDSLPFYNEELLYIEKEPKTDSRLMIDDISAETFLMVPNECGLANTTREIFLTENIKLKEYAGKALSYQMLETWATLGIGSTLLPKSKLSAPQRARIVCDKKGYPLRIYYEMRWKKGIIHSLNLNEFIKHFKTIVPAIIEGIHTKSPS